MGQVKVFIEDKDVSAQLDDVGNVREQNDDSVYFAGIIRRSSVNISFNNQSGLFSNGSSLFPDGRNNKAVTIIWCPENNERGDVKVFKGLINEGSTENNLSKHSINFTIVDYIKYLDDISIQEGDSKEIDKLYDGDELKLDAKFVLNFLNYYKNKHKLKLSFFVGLTFESIFPPSDSYYDATESSVGSVLNEIARSSNSFLITDGSLISLNPRPDNYPFRPVDNTDILAVGEQTLGFTKLYNSLTINNQKPPYLNQDSIDKYGLRNLNLNSYIVPSQQMADSFFEYYSLPKTEMDLSLRMNSRTLAYFVGDGLSLDVNSTFSKSVLELKGDFYILSRSLNFKNEAITFRIRKK